MIAVKNLSMDFGGKFLFKNISLQIKYGDRIGLIGNNGAGKTTFLKLISKNESPTNGSVKLKNNTKIGYLAQEVYLEQNNQLKPLVIGEEIKKKLIESRIE